MKIFVVLLFVNRKKVRIFYLYLIIKSGFFKFYFVYYFFIYFLGISLVDDIFRCFIVEYLMMFNV